MNIQVPNSVQSELMHYFESICLYVSANARNLNQTYSVKIKINLNVDADCCSCKLDI